MRRRVHGALDRVRRDGVPLLAACAIACNRAAPYRIGVVLDSVGIEGAASAAATINAQGGIDGHRLELRDVGGATATTARMALETAERLASDPTVLAVIGHTNSSSSLAASQVYNARHVVQLAPTSTAPLYSQAGPYSFRLVASDVHQGVFLADQVLARRPRPRAAVMFVNNDYGRPLHGVVVERLRAVGMVPVFDAPFSEGDSLGGAEIGASLARQRPDLLIWLGRASDFAPMARSLRAALPRLVVLASDAFSNSAVSHDTTHLFDGVRCVHLVNLERPDSVLQRLRASVRQAGRGELSDQAVLSYDAVTLLARAIHEAGPRRDAIRDWLAQVGRDQPAFTGLSGPITFSSGGDRAPQYFLVEIGQATVRAR